MTKDYYKILGIAEFETAENIKSAYRKLARKWHPDVAGDTPEVIAKFKEINEAYEILSNKVKKEEYDRARRFYSYATDGSKTREQKSYQTNPNEKTEKQEEKRGFYFTWEDFVSKRKREASYRNDPSSTPKRGEDINTDLEISVFEAMNGVTKTVNMLQTQTCPKCRGRRFVNGAICPHCKGKGEETNYKKFTVKIPPEIKNGSKIRLAGEGKASIDGGKNGDLYITIHIKETENYTTEGLNILKTIPVAPYEAVLGANIKVCTINGCVNVKLPANTQNGQKIRLAGCGIVQNKKIGDMIITVEIRIPRNLSEAEIALYKKLEEISTVNVREY